MTRWTDLTQHVRQAGAFCDLVPWFGFVDDGVFVTKSGALGLVLALDGIDHECLDIAARERATGRFESALRLFDEQTRVYQYLLKRPVTPRPEAGTGTPAVDALLARRHAFREQQGASSFDVALYVVVVADRPHEAASRLHGLTNAARHPWAAVRQALSTRKTTIVLDADMQRRVAQLRHRCDAFAQQLAEAGTPRPLDARVAFAFFRTLLNYEPAKADAVSLRTDTRLDFDTADSTLECHRGHLRLDDRYVRVLTLKEPPPQTHAAMFEALLDVPSPMVIATEWRREGHDRIRREIHARRRHYHNSRVSLTSYLGEPSQPGDLLVDDSASAVVRDLGAALTEVTLQGRYFGEWSLTVVLHDTDLAALERSVGAVLKAVAAHDAQVTDERFNLLHAWLAVLPGNSHYNVRGMYLLNTNAADLALLFAPDSGRTRNAHLNREALAVLDTAQGTPYHLNLHVGDVGHSLVLGATGAGKSFLLNFLIAHLQRYAPRTLVFDLGGSYRRLTRHFGGSELRLRLDADRIAINPFCLEPTAANLQFLFAFVRVLVQAGGQYTTTRADDQAIFEAVETLYALDPEQRRLFTLANILPRSLSAQLQRWVEGGQYAHVFDNVTDAVTLSPFQLVDFEGLDTVPLVLEPLLFYLLHRATATLLEPALAPTLKVFVIDEAWRFLRDPTIAAYVTEALKTWRKKNAMVLLATQSSDDLQRSELLRVALESCPTRIFLANPHVDQQACQELFGLNETEAARVATLVPRQECLLTQPGVARVLRLVTDPESAALFSAGTD
jgi:type IV secretion system protein TrbE